MEFAKIGPESYAAILTAGIMSFVVPIAIIVIWLVKKKERIVSVLVGAATFIIFAMLLEKPIQNLLLVPTQIGLKETGFSAFVGARPFLLALLLGLFPGVFEETGRFVAFKTVLRKYKNRETSISYGLGHGFIEVIILVGFSYLTYVSYAEMINNGTFGSVVELVRAQSPEQVGQLTLLAEQLTAIRFTDILLVFMERSFAVLFHMGCSILVFYSARDAKRIWLYPLAVLLHSLMDFVAVLYSFGLLSIPVWGLELFIAAFGIAAFLCGYCLLYRKDKAKPVQ